MTTRPSCTSPVAPPLRPLRATLISFPALSFLVLVQHCRLAVKYEYFLALIFKLLLLFLRSRKFPPFHPNVLSHGFSPSLFSLSCTRIPPRSLAHFHFMRLSNRSRAAALASASPLGKLSIARGRSIRLRPFRKRVRVVVPRLACASVAAAAGGAAPAATRAAPAAAWTALTTATGAATAAATAGRTTATGCPWPGGPPPNTDTITTGKPGPRELEASLCCPRLWSLSR